MKILFIFIALIVFIVSAIAFALLNTSKVPLMPGVDSLMRQFDKVAVPETADKKLSEFESANDTWKSRFNVSQISTSAFQAFYFNTQKPTVVVKNEVTENIGMNYVWDKGNGFVINSEDFGGYWIGNFSLDDEKVMFLTASHSWSEIRIILDGKILYKGGDSGGSATQRVIVPKGTHTIEVEYVNNWHTTGFSVSLTPAEALPKKITAKNVKSLAVSEVWYAGVYESTNSDRSIQLAVTGSATKPKVLVLSSYHPIIWDASLLKDANIRAIIVSSYNPGTFVKNQPAGVPVYESEQVIPYAYVLKATCATEVNLGLLGCEGLDDFTQVHAAITSIFSAPLTGFAGEYGTKRLTLPGNTLTPALIKDLLAHPEILRKKAEEHSKNQSLENIF